jgi:hypothetical protein
MLTPWDCLRLFVGGFSVSIVGQEVWMALWVTEPFWKHFGAFSGDPLLWGGILFLYGFRRCGYWFRSDGNGGLVGLHQ